MLIRPTYIRGLLQNPISTKLQNTYLWNPSTTHKGIKQKLNSNQKFKSPLYIAYPMLLLNLMGTHRFFSTTSTSKEKEKKAKMDKKEKKAKKDTKVTKENKKLKKAKKEEKKKKKEKQGYSLPPASFPDGKSLHEFITKHEWKRGRLKGDFKVPTKLSRALLERQERDDSLKQTYASLASRIQSRKQGSTSRDRTSNPLTGIYASSGGGKSYFLDQVAKLDLNDLNTFCEDIEMRAILQNSVAVTVTYISSTPFQEDLDTPYPNAGLALRVLHSYYCEDVPFDEVEILFRHQSAYCNLSLDLALECIQYSSQQNVLLLVDELVKSGGKNPVTLTIAIGRCLDGMGSKFSAIISVLELKPIQPIQTGSLRPINWIRLPPLSLEASLKLFPKQPPPILQVVSDCGGHPRSLELLHTILNEWKPSVWKPSYHQVLGQLITKLESFGYAAIPRKLVHVALKGEKVLLPQPLDESLPNQTYELFASFGWIINPPQTHDTFFCPKINTVQLIHYAQKKKTEDPIAAILLDMLETEPSFDWKQFGQFHIYWESMRHFLLNGTKMNLAAYYGITNNQFPIVDINARKIVYLNHQFPQKNGSVSSDKENNIDIVNSILVPAGNDGFDVVKFMKQTNTNSHACVNLEFKYSKPGSSTRLTSENIESKWNLVQKSYSLHFKGSTSQSAFRLRQKDIFLVVIAFPDSAIDSSLPEHVIVLDRSTLLQLYGPSLADRSQFIEWENQPKKKNKGNN